MRQSPPLGDLGVERKRSKKRYEMKVVIQRVLQASVMIDDNLKSWIERGLLVLVGIENADTSDDIEFLCKKIVNLRVFDDESGVMNLSVKEIRGEILCVSQFTLHASTKKGNRPSYIRASKPDFAVPMYDLFCKTLEELLEKSVETGVFGANMQISLVNDGPVTIIIDSKNKE